MYTRHPSNHSSRWEQETEERFRIILPETVAECSSCRHKRREPHRLKPVPPGSTNQVQTILQMQSFRPVSATLAMIH